MHTYSGKVTVGGTPDVRELAGLVITKASVGPMDNNTYLLRCRSTGEQLLIDAANDAQTIIAMVGGSLGHIVTTHQHYDHWQALAEVKSATGARTTAHELDAEGIPVATDDPVTDGDTITVGDVSLSVIHLVGHTPGSIALVYDDPSGHPHLFTGDCLFPGGIGNTFKDADNFATLIDGVETKLFGRLPDETWVYPGHGGDTTLGNERPNIAEWRARGW
ncbi:MBL fold metallo-hydrolase [Sporichthya sp.]|uniref:MBL fold metallo-hydrolase n=1 Tax=Sporichthya sp. TaxID=65475 RepID=UPI0017FCF432|nr:MBL fold metallo-hydrolase [Sporichthya sp.]MBA3743429.1 MBL fold metallo-hydrolase [Sporichthya sp.]